jgi:hypothetical protein
VTGEKNEKRALRVHLDEHRPLIADYETDGLIELLLSLAR